MTLGTMDQPQQGGAPVQHAAGASPPVFEQIFRNARFAQGGNAFFEGKVKGTPTPRIVWTRKGLQMKGEGKTLCCCLLTTYNLL